MNARVDFPGNRLLRLRTVTQITGLSRSEVYRRIAGGSFPKPVKIGPRASAWIESEVAAWVSERVTARNDEVAA